MAHINRRIVFLTDKSGGVAATAAFTEILGAVTVKIRLHGASAGRDNVFFAAEGQSLPFILREIIGETYETGKITSAADGGIWAALFTCDGKRADILAYGCLGEMCPTAQSLLNKALQNMAGDRIISAEREADGETAKTAVKEHSAETADNTAAQFAEMPDIEEIPAAEAAGSVAEEIQKIESITETAYKETFESIKSDKYMVEDTALNDIDIIAGENYFEKEEKTAEEKDILQKAEEQNATEPRQETENAGQYFGEGCFYIFPVKKFGSRPKNGQKKNGGKRMDHYQRIKARLNKLLAENPADEVLNGIIPDSKFVKIYYGEDRYYSLGLVKENDIPQYICYAVPSYYSENPPEEFNGLSRWVPADTADAKSKGYWVIFQNALDGKYIKT
jgi:hypothetical protein